MGECCSNENYPEERKIIESFEKMDNDNINEFTIINYEEMCEEISILYINTFEKLGNFQYLRINFINELKKKISRANVIELNNYPDYSKRNNNIKGNAISFHQMKMYNFNDTHRILYYIIIVTVTFSIYLKRKYITNEFEITLLELSVIIMNKNYRNNELKLILFYLSKMFEIVFPKVHNIQNYININEYLMKINIITENNILLTKEEKYLFLKTHIISLGEWFHNDYSSTLIDYSFRLPLMRYYAYLFVQNFDAIIQKDLNYQNILNDKYKSSEYKEDYYNENDFMLNEDPNLEKFNKINEDLNKIIFSIKYFFIISSEDIFTGKNIFYEFNNILQQELVYNNLQDNVNLIKFKQSLFHIFFRNLLSIEYNTTMLLSFFDYIIDYQRLENENSDTYYQMIINLYGKFNNDRIFLDKYSIFVSKLFFMEIEKSQNEKILIDELYRYIKNLNNNQNYNHLDDEKMNIKNDENLYFFINLIKNISFYYNKQKDINIFNNILVYLNKFIRTIRKDYQKIIININRTINTYLYENINMTFKNLNHCKNDFSFQLNESIQFNLSKFLSSYIFMINDLYQIDNKNLMIDFDNSIIYTITILEIKIIKFNKIKSIHKINKLLNILIKHINTKEINDHEEINTFLYNNIRLIKHQTYTSNNAYINIQFTTFHLNLIYIIIILILFNINKTTQELQTIVSKHNKLLLTINQINPTIGSTFQKLSDINNININNLFKLLQNPNFIITHISYIQILQIIQNEFFSDENSISTHNFRERNLYQNDKRSEMSIIINTKNSPYYNNRTHLLKNNYFINDSFSKYSNETFSYRRINNRSIQYNNNNIFHNDIFSEKIGMPLNNNYIHPNNYNNLIINNMNTNDDILSHKSSLSDFEIRI